jgi:hypothetical protein
MWKSMPLWAMAAIPAVPGFAIVLLQANGGSDGLQKVAFVLVLAGIVYVSFAMRSRRREAPSGPTPPKKILFSFVVWLVVVFILALVWANGPNLLRLIHS